MTEHADLALAIWLSITGHGAKATRRLHPFDRQSLSGRLLHCSNQRMKFWSVCGCSPPPEERRFLKQRALWVEPYVLWVFLFLCFKLKMGKKQESNVSCLVFLGTPSHSSLACACVLHYSCLQSQLMHSLVSANFSQFRKIDLYSFQTYFFDCTHAYALCRGWVMAGFNSLSTPFWLWKVFFSPPKVPSFVFLHAHHGTTLCKGWRFGTTPLRFQVKMECLNAKLLDESCTPDLLSTRLKSVCFIKSVLVSVRLKPLRRTRWKKWINQTYWLAEFLNKSILKRKNKTSASKK